MVVFPSIRKKLLSKSGIRAPALRRALARFGELFTWVGGQVTRSFPLHHYSPKVSVVWLRCLKGTMVLVLFGDTHEPHREVEVPAGDIVICVGDFTMFSKNLSAIEDFNEWLGEDSGPVIFHEVTSSLPNPPNPPVPNPPLRLSRILRILPRNSLSTKLPLTCHRAL
jgi:hypothetical protein